MNKNKLIFIIGDSRTGTLSVHKFLLSLGFNAIHYYVDEAKQIEPTYDHLKKNWENLKQFIYKSDYNAFSDYPTRTFFKELYHEFPNAYFVLTVRSSIKKWEKSMFGFFKKFNIELDIEKLKNNYTFLNNEISNFFKNKNNFLTINIDEDNDENSKKLKCFLGIESKAILGLENKTSHYDTYRYPYRYMLYNTESQDYISYVEGLCYNTKAMPSEYGWLFLINDTNQYIRQLYDNKTWNDNELEIVVSLFKKRFEYFNRREISYYKFIVPEKAVIYKEFLPRIFKNKNENNERPAMKLLKSELDNIYYLKKYLIDLKSYGLLYFKGDTHTNWLGAYFVYLFIVQTLNSHNAFDIVPPIKLCEMTPSLAGYEGDLYVQMLDRHKKILSDIWSELFLKENFENLIQYQISDKNNKAHKVEIPDEYLSMFTSRETLIYENENKNLPVCVVFRDSTADFIIELLAQHFSRTVFIWHNGEIFENVINREKPNFVLHLMAERFIIDYPNKVPYVPVV